MQCLSWFKKQSKGTLQTFYGSYEATDSLFNIWYICNRVNDPRGTVTRVRAEVRLFASCVAMGSIPMVTGK